MPRCETRFPSPRQAGQLERCDYDGTQEHQGRRLCYYHMLVEQGLLDPPQDPYRARRVAKRPLDIALEQW